METAPQSDPGMAKLAELIGPNSIAMLTTLEPDGALRSRPLATLQLDREGRLWFFTSISSQKVAEIDQHRDVNLSYADPARADYVSISGTTQILRERARIRELWSTWARPWFPNGPDDPDIALLCVTVQSAEYWESPASKVQRLFGLAKALAGDTEALGEHGRITPAARSQQVSPRAAGEVTRDT
jgi:general stress protein 26